MSESSCGHSRDSNCWFPPVEHENMDTFEGSEKGKKYRETLMAAVLLTAVWKAGKGFSVFCRTLPQIRLCFLLVLFVLFLKAKNFTRNISNKTCTIPPNCYVIIHFNLILKIITSTNILLHVCHMPGLMLNALFTLSFLIVIVTLWV